MAAGTFLGTLKTQEVCHNAKRGGQSAWHPVFTEARRRGRPRGCLSSDRACVKNGRETTYAFRENGEMARSVAQIGRTIAST